MPPLVAPARGGGAGSWTTRPDGPCNASKWSPTTALPFSQPLQPAVGVHLSLIKFSSSSVVAHGVQIIFSKITLSHRSASVASRFTARDFSTVSPQTMWSLASVDRPSQQPLSHKMANLRFRSPASRIKTTSPKSIKGAWNLHIVNS